MSDVVNTMLVNDQQRAVKLVEACRKIREQVGRIVVGQEEVIEQLLIAILARGHCLLEGVPGLAKTLMVRSLADSMSLSFHRIQFTPDLMPADIIGTDIIQENRETGHRDMVFEKGPVFSQMLLADEINRTPPKTQAALLEAMLEHEVTVGGTTYRLEEPFFVLVTAERDGYFAMCPSLRPNPGLGGLNRASSISSVRESGESDSCPFAVHMARSSSGEISPLSRFTAPSTMATAGSRYWLSIPAGSPSTKLIVANSKSTGDIQ